MISSIVLTSEFSSAHLYEQKKWSPEKNTRIFGACYTQYGHGHNYKWEVTLQVPRSKSSRIGANFADNTWIENSQNALDQIVKTLDHQHLNFVIAEFSEKIPTTENISLYLKEKLLQTDLTSSTLSFRLFETENLWTQVQIQKPNEHL